MEQDLTTGSVFKRIVYFSLPYLLSYFLQTLYGMADLFITGQFYGVDTITAVSNGSQIMHLSLIHIQMCIRDRVLYDRNRLSVSVTIGMAALAKDMSVDEIINNADMKLYEGKKSGKNKVM